MALTFGEHADVLFNRAPLENVICQIRFSPVLALLDPAGVAGFQEALRPDYPELDQDSQAAVAVGPAGGSIQTTPTNWRLSTLDRTWRVSIGVDFVALETADALGYSFQEFWRRFDEVLQVLDRTVRVPTTRRVGFRKINVLTHPEVTSSKEWRGLLRSELLGLSAAEAMPDHFTQDYAEIHFPDEESGTLAVRHGMDPNDPSRYRLDLDYWTDRVIPLGNPNRIEALIHAYADSITSFFHWSLEERMYQYLEPRPRRTPG